MSDPIHVTVWNENIHEQKNPAVQKIYPDGIHEALAAGLRASLGDAVALRTATLEQPEHGLTESVLAAIEPLRGLKTSCACLLPSSFSQLTASVRSLAPLGRPKLSERKRKVPVVPGAGAQPKPVPGLSLRVVAM